MQWEQQEAEGETQSVFMDDQVVSGKETCHESVTGWKALKSAGRSMLSVWNCFSFSGVIIFDLSSLSLLTFNLSSPGSLLSAALLWSVSVVQLFHHLFSIHKKQVTVFMHISVFVLKQKCVCVEEVKCHFVALQHYCYFDFVVH